MNDYNELFDFLVDMGGRLYRDFGRYVGPDECNGLISADATQLFNEINSFAEYCNDRVWRHQ